MTQVSKSNSLVDLYQLLDLAPLTTDRSAIERSLKSCANAAKKASDESEKRRLAKIFELGKANLLDSQRKSAYDRKWKEAFAKETEKDWDWRPLETLLPQADPNQPFDLATFLEHSADLPTSSPAEDFAKLKAILSGEPVSTPVRIPEPVVTQPIVAEEIDAAQKEGKPASSVLPKSSTSPNSVAKSTQRQPKSLAKNIRRKRDRSLLLMVGGMLASVAAVLAVILIVLQSTKEDGASEAPLEIAQANSRDNPTPKDVPIVEQSNAPNEPRRSGLPAVNLGGTPNENNVPTQVLEGSENGEPATPDKTNMGNGESMQGDDEMTPKDAVMEQPQEPPTLAVPTLSDAEKLAWQESMMGARALLSEQQYSEAQKKFEELEQMAKLEAQKAQLIRLKTAADLAETCYEALLAAMADLEPGASFQVKSMEVAFVEGGPEQLVVRIAGQNQRYELTQLPVGILEGLVDLKLDTVNLRARAARAAFILFHPRANQLSLPRARKILSEAEAQGRVPKGTLLVFDDDYRL